MKSREPVHTRMLTRMLCSSAFWSASRLCQWRIYKVCFSTPYAKIVPVSSDSTHLLLQTIISQAKPSFSHAGQIITLKMKAPTISSVIALLAAFTQAAPIPAQVDARQFLGTITFEGVNPDAYYVRREPVNGSIKLSTSSTFAFAVAIYE